MLRHLQKELVPLTEGCVGKFILESRQNAETRNHWRRKNQDFQRDRYHR